MDLSDENGFMIHLLRCPPLSYASDLLESRRTFILVKVTRSEDGTERIEPMLKNLKQTKPSAFERLTSNGSGRGNEDGGKKRRGKKSGRRR